MCCRTRILSVALAALGIGFLLSCLLKGWLPCVLLGAGLIAVSLLLGHDRS